MIRVPAGNQLPLTLIIPTGETGLSPRATIYNMYMTKIAGPINLTDQGGGIYTATYTPPAQMQYRVVYTVYTDQSYSTVSRWGRTEEQFDVNSAFEDIGTVKNLTGSNSGKAK